MPARRWSRVPLVFGSISMVAVVSSLSFSQSAHAEGLLPAVTCLVQTLLLTECPSQTPTSPTSSPQAQTPPHSTQSTTPSNTSSAPSVKPAQSSQSSSVNSLQPLPVDQPQSLPSMTEADPTVYPSAQPFNEVSYFNTYSKYASQPAQSEGSALIEPSREGWKIVGIAWYWWLFISAAIAGLVWGTSVALHHRRIPIHIDK